jgi:hypothetical protein
VGILTEDMKRLVREQQLGFVATVCPDGYSQLVAQRNDRSMGRRSHRLCRYPLSRDGLKSKA